MQGRAFATREVDSGRLDEWLLAAQQAAEADVFSVSS
jgi:hypothetical protein